MRQNPGIPETLREKLDTRDEVLLTEVVLNCILEGTGVSVVVPSMLQLKHLRNNVRAVEQCRFSAPELQLLRSAFAQMSGSPSH